MSDGRYVLCQSAATDGEAPHTVGRATCLMKLREACGTCKNSMVAIRFQLRVVDQLVACPRWRNEEERKERKDPLDYVQVQRDTCVRVKPFPHCVSCPNSNPSKSPQTQAKWFELEERRKRIERELDEEEQDE